MEYGVSCIRDERDECLVPFVQHLRVTCVGAMSCLEVRLTPLGDGTVPKRQPEMLFLSTPLDLSDLLCRFPSIFLAMFTFLFLPLPAPSPPPSPCEAFNR